MKKLFLLPSFIIIALSSQAQYQTLHDFSEPDIYGDTLDLSAFYGMKVLVVNTASFCGFTYEYGELQQLYDEYGGSNFEILGFPSDDFNQEYDDDSSIIEFCTDIYGITFQMMSITHVKGINISDIYDWLTHESLNGVANAPVLWNFQKFAINELGQWVTWYPTSMSPLDTAITNWIESPSVISGLADSTSHENELMIHHAGNIVVDYYSKNSGEVLFTLSDILGNKIFSKRFIALHGNNRFEFAAPASGVYVGSAMIAGKNISQKVAVTY